MRRWMVGALAPLLVGCVVTGCDDPPLPDAVLEIGYEEEDPASGASVFVPYAPGDRVRLIPGPGGLELVMPSLRARDVPAGLFTLELALWLDGLVIGRELPWGPQESPGEEGSFVIWNVNVPFQAETCCFNCREVLLTATLTDSAGRDHRGEVTVLVARSECPDPAVCCPSADFCPDPVLPVLCL